MLDYAQAIKLDPNFALAYSKRGLAYSAKGDYDQAILDHTRAIELAPNFAAAYSNRGNTYSAKGDDDQAILDSTRAIELDPNLVVAYHVRGNAYAAKGDDDQAILEYTQAIKIDPNDYYAYRSRGWAYERKGVSDNAKADYSKADSLDPVIIAKVAAEKAAAEARAAQRARFTVIPANFEPTDYTHVDLFDAVTASKRLTRADSRLEAELANAFSAYGGIFSWAGVSLVRYVSDLTFVWQNGTDIEFSSDDNAISQYMTIGQRSGLKAGQKVKVYYEILRAPLLSWNIIAIEKR
jgi:tetratricopeptide (TPR) repeat protein